MELDCSVEWLGGRSRGYDVTNRQTRAAGSRSITALYDQRRALCAADRRCAVCTVGLAMAFLADYCMAGWARGAGVFLVMFT